MASKPGALLLADLGVTKTQSAPTSPMTTHSRKASPNPLIKYRPEFPERFGSIQDARSF